MCQQKVDKSLPSQILCSWGSITIINQSIGKDKCYEENVGQVKKRENTGLEMGNCHFRQSLRKGLFEERTFE